MHPPPPSDTTEPNPPAPLVAAVAERYRVERRLGAGGMATVYLATDVRHDRQVALKVLRPELAAVLGAERFLNEVRITARLEHPHIVTLIDSGESNGYLWYVLPYIRGESLRDRLVRERQIGVDESLAITRQVAGALDYAHRQGVIHRDIKPENILLHEGEAMLADFGIALAVTEAAGNRLTETGISLGTPQYMSPEQATGDRNLDARCDVYSLAAVLYEMLAGEPPHNGPTVQAVIAKLMTERPTRLRTVRDTVPEGVDTAVARALAKIPADRYASADEFARALAAREAGEHGRSRAGGVAARWRAPVIVAGIAVLAAAVGAVVVRREAPRVIVQPERVQLTFTGNARYPSLSADGRRLAYTARECADDGRCTDDLVVQDVAGAGSATILRGWARISGTQWTNDGRYLLVDGLPSLGGNWGMFSVPSLGGDPRFLGCCDGALVGGGDTVFMNSGVPRDSVAEFKWVSVSDGTVYDSVITVQPSRTTVGASPFAGGQFLVAILRRGGRVTTVLVMDRRGRTLDSLAVDASRFSRLWPDPEARRFLLEMRRANDGGTADLIAYDVTSNGRIDQEPDTVMRQFDAETGSISREGMLTYQHEPGSYEIWALKRETAGSLRFTQRRLATGTGFTGGAIDLQGTKVAAVREVMMGGRRLRQLSVIPVDSGTERPVGPPADIAGGAAWAPEGKTVMSRVRRGADSIEVREINIATGRATSLATVHRDAAAVVVPLPGGGFVLGSVAGDALRLMGVPNRRDTTFTLPEPWMRFARPGSSPDGRDVVFFQWDRLSDSVLVSRISLADGRLTRLAAFAADSWGGSPPAWHSDGTITVPIIESGGTTVWYRLRPPVGSPVRLGIPPRQGGYYSFSSDGLRAAVNGGEAYPDIYLIRNFQALLGSR